MKGAESHSNSLGCVRLSLLAVLALALFAVDDAVQAFAWRLGDASEFAEVSILGRLVGSILGPLITAMLFAYPIARLNSRRSPLVPLATTVPVAVSTLAYLRHATTDASAVLITHLCAVCIIVPVCASLAGRCLPHTRLLICGDPVQEEPLNVQENQCSARPAHALNATLLVALAFAVFAALNVLQYALFDLIFLIRERPYQLTG